MLLCYCGRGYQRAFTLMSVIDDICQTIRPAVAARCHNSLLVLSITPGRLLLLLLRTLRGCHALCTSFRSQSTAMHRA